MYQTFSSIKISSCIKYFLAPKYLLVSNFFFYQNIFLYQTFSCSKISSCIKYFLSKKYLLVSNFFLHQNIFASFHLSSISTSFQPLRLLCSQSWITAPLEEGR